MATKRQTVRTFGGWTVPREEGLFGLTLPMTIAFLGWLIGLIGLPVIFGIKAMIFWAIAGVIAGGAMLAKVEGRTLLEWIGLTMGFRRDKKKGLTKYQSGPFSKIPDGHYQLPGVAGKLECYRATTSGDQKFAMLHYPAKNEYTVLLEVWPQGTGIDDDDVVNGWVDQWGAALSSFGDDADIVGVTAVVDTFPSSGMKVRNEVARITAPSAPELAQRIMIEAGELQSTQTIDMQAWMSITVKANTAAKKSDPGAAAVDLGIRMQFFMQRLDASGVRSRPMSEDEVVMVTKRAYSPASHVDMEAASQEVGGHGIRWIDAGPEQAEQTLTNYIHDGAVSAVWEMREPPRGYVPQTVLKALMSKNEDVPFKRVTMCYRPHSGAEAAKIVDRDANNKAEKVKQERTHRKTAKASSERDAIAADSARHAEAMGHGLVRFGILITVTEPAPALQPDGTMSESKLTGAEEVMKSLTQRARLQIRRRYASQQISFAAGLGIGVLIPEHLSATAKTQA
jgi:hypothetical protein